ncbi:acetylxylan esterase [Sphingobacterium paucimobilis]|uniref:Acetyl xylan esterase domain-containing protein n=1 Tax=Sphingobacterium paucimobilis HER1398 TaxID=1346330 RepID=U2IYR8_9SPHI|nr:acetylxylan esterase [Sphingobacterium paucimobilis]ERJ57859.1 hypothetical protein M472_03675 [Sphingobacterium paucimobilis HER1398]ERJ60310.1 hypothetical protein M472_16245 [Sphingobacterium paucimobilis HER1398]
MKSRLILKPIGKVGLLLALCLLSLVVYSQRKPQALTFGLSLDHSDWVYKVGEPVKVTGVVKYNGNVLRNIKINYEAGPEMLSPLLKDSTSLTDGTFAVDMGTMDQPGFLRFAVSTEYEGTKYREVITAGFDPYSIQPTVEMPVDFMQFWNNAIEQNRKLPLETTMTLLPERSTEDVNVYEVSFQNYKEGSRIYGILCVPKAEGKYPAIFNPPGAGIHKIQGDLNTAQSGFITLQIGIHGIPLNMDAAEYKKLANTTFKRYRVDGMNNRDTYYFKRVYLGCVRAIDFIYTLPQFDGENIAAVGGSQGGALSLVTTALDSRIKYISAYAPALADLPGYLHNRAGGWPHLFKSHVNDSNRERATKSLQYYDAVNFAKNIKVPGLYSWGFNDETTPPTTMFAVYNSITAPKELFIAKETGHWYSNEQTGLRKKWLKKTMKK